MCLCKHTRDAFIRLPLIVNLSIFDAFCSAFSVSVCTFSASACTHTHTRAKKKRRNAHTHCWDLSPPVSGYYNWPARLRKCVTAESRVAKLTPVKNGWKTIGEHLGERCHTYVLSQAFGPLLRACACVRMCVCVRLCLNDKLGLVCRLLWVTTHSPHTLTHTRTTTKLSRILADRAHRRWRGGKNRRSIPRTPSGWYQRFRPRPPAGAGFTPLLRKHLAWGELERGGGSARTKESEMNAGAGMQPSVGRRLEAEVMTGSAFRLESEPYCVLRAVILY